MEIFAEFGWQFSNRIKAYIVFVLFIYPDFEFFLSYLTDALIQYEPISACGCIWTTCYVICVVKHVGNNNLGFKKCYSDYISNSI